MVQKTSKAVLSGSSDGVHSSEPDLCRRDEQDRRRNRGITKRKLQRTEISSNAADTVQSCVKPTPVHRHNII
jgi:hypothetical protein